MLSSRAVRRAVAISVVLVAGPAFAQSPVLDGDIDDVILYLETGADLGMVENDPGLDICKTNPLVIPCNAPQVPCAIGTYFVNGFDAVASVVAYDAAGEILYLGMRTAGAIGDSDGDGTAGPGIGCTPPLNQGELRVQDASGIGPEELYEWGLDTDCDGLADILFRTQGGSGGTVAIEVLGIAAGAAQGAYVGNELEARVEGIHLPPGWRMRLFAGSTADGLIEDFGGFSAFTPDPFLALRAGAPVHDQPICGVPGDFTGDGILDFALVVDGGVQILKALAPTTYDSLASVPTGGVGRGIATGNFNDDTALDLAVATSTGLHVVIGGKLGEAPLGSFLVPVTYEVGTDPQDIEVADFNEDGVLDLAVAVTGGDRVAVLLGHPIGNGVSDGTFGSPAEYPVGTAPRFLAQGDWNDDGVTDLAVTNSSSMSNSISILLGHSAAPEKGDGTFDAATEVLSVSAPRSIVAGDFNEDGATDLAVGSTDGGGIGIHLGGQSNGFGDGTFAPANIHPAPESCEDIATGDFNQDGRTDLMVAMGPSGLVRFLYGEGAGTAGDGSFTVGPTLDVGGSVSGVVVENFDGAGPPDAMIVRFDPDEVIPARGVCTLPPANTFALHEFANPGPFQHGAHLYVEWDRGPDTKEVNLDFSPDGTTWERVATRVTDTRFRWTVPPVSTLGGRLRLVDAWNHVLTDTTETPFELTASGVGVEDPGDEGESGPGPGRGLIALSAPRPNPSRGAVTLELVLARPVEVRVGVYDVAGRRVREILNGPWSQLAPGQVADGPSPQLAPGQVADGPSPQLAPGQVAAGAGTRVVTWDGRDDAGRAVPPGVYWVRAVAGTDRVETQVRQILRLPE